MPVFVHESLRWIRQHPLAAALCAILIGGVTYWQLQPPRRPIPQQAEAARSFAGVVPPTATLEKALAELQRDNEQLRLQLDTQVKTLEALRRQQEGREAARQQRLADQERRVEAALNQALAAARATPTAPTLPVITPSPPPPPRLRILRPETPPPPPAAPSPPPHPPGCALGRAVSPAVVCSPGCLRQCATRGPCRCS